MRQLILTCVLCTFCLVLSGCAEEKGDNKPAPPQQPLPKGIEKVKQNSRDTN